MHKLTILLFVEILFIVVDCNIIKRQITFPNNESDSESDEKVIEGRHWGINHRRTKRPRPGRPTRPTSTTSTTTGNPNEVPQHIQECIDECPRQTTSEYNPVCGTDDRTYNNLNRLHCAADCGLDVQFHRVGTCQPLR